MKKITTLVFALAIAFAFIAPDANSAPKPSECNGLKAKECKKNPGCTWVKKFKKKDGKVVKGYCKGKGGKPMKKGEPVEKKKPEGK